ncbi:MAG: family 43 glycosylhydrolase, partial [Cyclobacteriaceae bacterium]
NFTVIDQNITMNFHPRHGSVLPITLEEKEVLLEKWGAFSGSIVGSASPLAKRNNLVIDEETNSIYIPVKESVDITAFDPALKLSSGASIAPYGAQDFSKGTVPYFLSLSGKQGSQKYNVRVAKDHNPVLDGYYADPEIVYSEQLDKYFLYPTSDGFMDWSGTYFETFSSSDLVNWENEGVVLDLKVDVEWADRNAWAPAAIERKMGSSYKYFYYFTAAQKIGVATSDNPAGPFVDSGKPIIDFKPKGVTGGQEIDPDVFHDPVSGKDYLYWGNGYMAVAELNEDMISIDESTIKVLTPDATYREGTEVFFRQGEYYFLWSEGDTRSPDYRVRYAFMESPIGPLTMPEENLILSKDEKTGIYGTGHCSVVQATGTEDWYMVYHRFTRPMGIEMGSSAGFHREVCFDKMEFKIDGEIKVIRPTLSGI